MSANKNAATDFLRLASSGHAREAFGRYAGMSFRHHNPWFAGDADSLMTAMDDNARQNPEKHLEVLRAIEEGDLVAVHSHVRHRKDERGFALVHIFRFEGGKIVEAWDLAQEVPAGTPNEHGMF